LDPLFTGFLIVSALAAAVAIVIVAAWTGRPLEGRALIRTADWLTPYNVRHAREANAALAARDPAGAAAAYIRFFQHEPDVSQLSSQYDVGSLVVLAQMHLECASYSTSGGQAEQARSQIEKARVFADTAIRRDPSNLQAQRVLADAYFAGESFGEAATSYRTYLEARPNDPVALAHFGVSLVAAGNLEGAIEAFRRAVDLEPRNADAHMNLANALFDHRDAAGAAEQARLAVALRPLSAAAHDLLGRSLAVLGRIEEAKSEFERALAIDPASEAAEDLRRIRR